MLIDILHCEGGASGLGKHLAEDLHSKGVNLVIADINETTGKATVDIFKKRRDQ